jgi:hypothetical protein
MQTHLKKGLFPRSQEYRGLVRTKDRTIIPSGIRCCRGKIIRQRCLSRLAFIPRAERRAISMDKRARAPGGEVAAPDVSTYPHRPPRAVAVAEKTRPQLRARHSFQCHELQFRSFNRACEDHAGAVTRGSLVNRQAVLARPRPGRRRRRDDADPVPIQRAGATGLAAPSREQPKETGESRSELVRWTPRASGPAWRASSPRPRPSPPRARHSAARLRHNAFLAHRHPHPPAFSQPARLDRPCRNTLFFSKKKRYIV